MVRLTLSHIVAILPLLINQLVVVSGASYYARLYDGSNVFICRVHVIEHNRSISFEKDEVDAKENASLFVFSGSETEVGFPSTSTTRRRRDVVPSNNSCSNSALVSLLMLRGGAAASVSIAAFNPFPSGYHPFGYGITDLGRSYLEFDGSIDSDIGKFLSTFKGGAGDGGGGSGKRKSTATMKDQWLEIVRVAKTGQSMRIYRRLDDIIAFCIKAGFLD